MPQCPVSKKMSLQQDDSVYAWKLQAELDEEHAELVRWYAMQIYWGGWISRAKLQQYDTGLRLNEPERQRQLQLNVQSERARIRRAHTVY